MAMEEGAPVADRLEYLVSLWRSRIASGQDIPVADLCSDCPDLVADLETRVRAIRSAEALDSPTDVHAGGATTTWDGNGPASNVQGFEVIEEITCDYAREAARSAPPSIVEYLGKIREGLKSALLRNLLQVDIERRRLAGERPRIEDYLPWFPGHEVLIRQEFLASASIHGSRLPAREPGPAAGPPREGRTPLARRLGDYHLVRELGRGGMGLVFEAVHAHRNDRVALKTLPEVEPDALHRFKREVRSLADVNHANLIGLHTLECDGGQWFFTMDLIDGVDFASHVRPGGRLDEARLRSGLAQLVTGVMALHANYIVHLDLKPSNVMVDGDGRVVLLDFGLVRELGRGMHSAANCHITGTPAYMSPEQARGEAGRRRTGTPSA